MNFLSASQDFPDTQFYVRLDRDNGDAFWAPMEGVHPNHAPHSARVPFQLNLELERIEWARLSQSQLQHADFLDQRILDTIRPDFIESTSTQVPQIESQTGNIWILHFGHCGSTSFSRGLSQYLNRPAYREPGAMWALFRQFAADGGLSEDNAQLAKRLIAIMSSTLGPAIIKPSSLHTEFLSQYVVNQSNSKVIFLVNDWKTCVLNGLKDLEHSEKLGGDYPSYERHAWQLFRKHDVDHHQLEHFKRNTPPEAATLLLGWLGKVLALKLSWDGLEPIHPKTIASFQHYLEAPQYEFNRVLKTIGVDECSGEPTDLTQLGKGSALFQTSTFKSNLDNVAKKHRQSIADCQQLIGTLQREPTLLGKGLELIAPLNED